MDQLQTQITEFLESVPISDWATKLILGFIILILGKYLAKKFVDANHSLMLKKGVDPAVVGFVTNILYVVLLLVVLIAAMSQIGINTTSFVAVLGAAGLAVGLALQGSLSNFASGVLIITLRPFKAGDFVEVSGLGGTVVRVELFSTTLKTPDNKVIYIPNSSITGSPITNYSKEKTRRIDFIVGISYDADLKKAKSILQSMAKNDERVLEEPSTTIAVSELADSSVNLVFRPWVNAENYWTVYFEFLEKIKLEFDDANIGIPYPQMDIHLNKQ